jgi:hypothetical protein
MHEIKLIKLFLKDSIDYSSANSIPANFLTCDANIGYGIVYTIYDIILLLNIDPEIHQPNGWIEREVPVPCPCQPPLSSPIISSSRHSAVGTYERAARSVRGRRKKAQQPQPDQLNSLGSIMTWHHLNMSSCPYRGQRRSSHGEEHSSSERESLIETSSNRAAIAQVPRAPFRCPLKEPTCVDPARLLIDDWHKFTQFADDTFPLFET